MNQPSALLAFAEAHPDPVPPCTLGLGAPTVEPLPAEPAAVEVFRASWGYVRRVELAVTVAHRVAA